MEKKDVIIYLAKCPQRSYSETMTMYSMYSVCDFGDKVCIVLAGTGTYMYTLWPPYYQDL